MTNRVTNKEGMGFLVADVYRLLRRAFEKRLENSPLTLAQARALVYVSRHEGVRQVELAELLDVQPITLARLVDQLESAGIVERRADKTDRRAFLVYLTPTADTHLDAIDDVIAKILSDAQDGMSETEVNATAGALLKMRSNLTAAR